MMTRLEGRHYGTGTLINTLAAMGARDPNTGKPYSEALAFGAGGGVAFGNFSFEYKGHLPHVAILTRNTFTPFERALDNLAIRRESRETTDAARAESNVRLELDAGNVPIVLADMFSLPHRGLAQEAEMWQMNWYAVLEQKGEGFIIADGSQEPILISAADLRAARGKVKKDRFKMAVLEAPDPSRIPEGLIKGMETCAALYLDKPPAGSQSNFGAAGLRHWAKMLVDVKNAKGWPRLFAPGPRLTHVLAGGIWQPGVWDWINTWGTADCADRGTYAVFLREAAAWTGLSALGEVADMVEECAPLWGALGDAALPNDIPEMKELKALKRMRSDLWFQRGQAAQDERAALRAEIEGLIAVLADPAKLETYAARIREEMASIATRIAMVEEAAIQEMRAVIAHKGKG